jgi:hypothetical protein
MPVKQGLIILLIFAGALSCKKDSKPTPGDNYPQSVTFTYGGKTETFGVVKRTYSKDAAGQPLPAPVVKLWLDRNLGASRVAISPYDTLASGDLFQWGRQADGHQYRYSKTTDTASATIVPGHDKFIVKSPDSDWLITHNDSLWNGISNTNCPCPNGWRVPAAGELGMEMHSWDSLTLNAAWASPLKWSVGGDRDGVGHVLYATYWSFIWSSTTETDGDVSCLAIIGGYTAEVTGSSRIFGLSVRCIRDY